MDINKNCTITNNSGKDVVVLNAVGSASNAVTGSTQMVYQQQLTIQKMSDGSKLIPNGKSVTTVLDGTYVDKNGNTKPSFLYELILADSLTLAPVKNVGELLDFESESYPPVTATSDDATAMSQAMFFAQTIAAYPSSNLAKNFTKTLQDAEQNGDTVTQIEAAVQQFFAGTKGYTKADFPSYVAVTTYMSTFLSPWVPVGSKLYLYSSADAGDPSQPNSKQPNSGSNQGTITFTAGSGSVNPADHNSGYTVQLAPANNGPSVTLYFDNGQLVDQITDIPSIALQGTWALKSTFTHKDTDNTLWPIFVGTVGGTQVIAVAQPPESDWAKFWSGLTFQKVINMFLEGMGIWMALDFLKTKLAGKEKKLSEDKANENDGKDPSPEQQQKAKQQSDQIGDKARQEQQDIADRLGKNGGKPNVEVPKESGIDGAQNNFKDVQVDTLKQTSSDAVESSISEGQFQLKEAAKFGVNEQLEDSASSLQDAKSDLSSGDFTSAKSNLSEARTSLNEGVGQLDIPEDVKQSIQESQKAQGEYEKASDEIDSEGEDVEGGDVPDIDVD